MATRSVAFRVESNKAKSSFWYTLVAGNGNTVMTSKATYVDRSTAKRAARNQILSMQSADLVLEYDDGSGRRVREVVGGEPSVAITPEEARLHPERSPYAG